MNTRLLSTILLASACGAGFLGYACSGPEESTAAASASNAASSRTADEPDEPILSQEDANIPSQEDADKDAEGSINDGNADAELEKLEKELEEGGGGG